MRRERKKTLGIFHYASDQISSNDRCCRSRMIIFVSALTSGLKLCSGTFSTHVPGGENSPSARAISRKWSADFWEQRFSRWRTQTFFLGCGHTCVFFAEEEHQYLWVEVLLPENQAEWAKKLSTAGPLYPRSVYLGVAWKDQNNPPLHCWLFDSCVCDV